MRMITLHFSWIDQFHRVLSSYLDDESQAEVRGGHHLNDSRQEIPPKGHRYRHHHLALLPSQHMMYMKLETIFHIEPATRLHLSR